MNPTMRILDGARAPSPSGKPWAEMLAATIAASAALLLAGCGGSSAALAAPQSATSTDVVTAAGAPPNSQSVEAGAVNFARCIRSHGVSDFPDPASDGRLTIPPDDRNTPAFESASKACQSLMPGAAGQRSDMSRAQELQVVKCIRAHGVPNFPDPDASGAIPQGSVDPASPGVKAALQACMPAGGPPRAR